MGFSAGLLSATIWKLKSAKVNKTDSGHLNMVDASVLLGLQIAMIITGVFSVFFVDQHSSSVLTYTEITRDLIDFALGCMYFKMITNFITKFTLQTHVNTDGNIDIVGIDKWGHEIFKFSLQDD